MVCVSEAGGGKLSRFEGRIFSMEYIIQVDENDREIAPIEKLAAHRKGLLHRAFSILIFNAQKQLLLQKRHQAKYHSGGLWTNSCCSHPRDGEPIRAAAKRRLREELGIVCELTPAFEFTYRAELDNGLIENEYDHVFIGRYNGPVYPNKDEIEAIRWASLEEVRADIQQHPDDYTYWFRYLMEHYAEEIRQKVD